MQTLSTKLKYTLKLSGGIMSLLIPSAREISIVLGYFNGPDHHPTRIELRNALRRNGVTVLGVVQALIRYGYLIPLITVPNSVQLTDMGVETWERMVQNRRRMATERRMYYS